MKSLSVTTFKSGIIDTIEDRSIPRGAASRSLNWLTMGDSIELRRGFTFMGDVSQVSGAGRATGLKKASNALQVEVLFYTYGQKLKYFDETTDEWVEVGSDLLGAAANGEDISLAEYVTNAGNQLWLNSPNCAGFFKIMTANPGSAVDQYNSSKNYKGHIKIDTNACFLWGRTKDKTGVYRSYIDELNSTTVTAEALASGDGATLAFSGTLAFKGGGSKRTCFGVTVTDGTETFTDDYAGTLTGDLGGTGTINYATGAWAVTFNTAPAIGVNNITSTYQWEDATNHGIADFTKSATRLAGEGAIWRQDEGGGPVRNISSYNNVYYCMHEKSSWALTIAIDDTPSGSSNLPYRKNVGIPALRASVETGEGIYYIDKTSSEDPAVRLLTYDRSGSQQVIPVPLSNNLDLNAYEFDTAAAFAWGDLRLFACRTSDSTVNNRTLVYNRFWKSWDIFDYAISSFDTYNGALVAGDSLSSNVMTLFSGLADDDSIIANYWEGSLDDLTMAGLKKNKKMRLAGNIGPDQKLKVSLSFDNGPFVEIGGSDDTTVTPNVHTYAIEGSGAYVDRTQRVSIGPLTLGRGEIGGGSNGVEAYPYDREFSIGVEKFSRAKIRLEAIDIGYVSVSQYTFRDIRSKGDKAPRKYRG